MKIVEKREISEVSTEVLTIKKGTKVLSLNINAGFDIPYGWSELQMEIHDKDIGNIVLSVKAHTASQCENLMELIDAVKLMNNFK